MSLREAAVLTIAGLAAELRISRDRAYQLKHEIGFIRVGRLVRLRRQDVDEYLRRNEFGRREPQRKTVRVKRLVCPI